MHDLDDVKVLDLVGSWFTCGVRSMFRGMPGLHLVCSRLVFRWESGNRVCTQQL